MIMFLVKLIIFIIILGDDGPDNVLRNSISIDIEDNDEGN